MVYTDALQKTAGGEKKPAKTESPAVWGERRDMVDSRKYVSAAAKQKNRRRCLSCGASDGMAGRKYCSVACRQKLRYHLNVRSGLLRALNTRYATFYFTDDFLVMDVLPFDGIKLYSFIYPRSADKKPVEDFSEMSNVLGNAWWQEMKRTNRKYLASNYVLGKAAKRDDGRQTLKPLEIRTPAVRGRSKALIYLRLGSEDLRSPDLKKVIKSAYRRQARIHHPDLGGDEAAFRKIHEAYLDLVRWAEAPSFSRRCGFPDKWFYDGVKNKWVQPTPL